MVRYWSIIWVRHKYCLIQTTVSPKYEGLFLPYVIFFLSHKQIISLCRKFAQTQFCYVQVCYYEKFPQSLVHPLYNWKKRGGVPSIQWLNIFVHLYSEKLMFIVMFVYFSYSYRNLQQNSCDGLWTCFAKSEISVSINNMRSDCPFLFMIKLRH